MSSIQMFSPRQAHSESPGVGVNIASLPHALDVIVKRAKSRKGYTLFTINLDHLVKLKSDHRFRDAYRRADLVSADGWPIVWLLQRQAARVERTTGADLVEPLCKQAVEHGLPIYFIGPSRPSQDAALNILRARYPGLIVAGAEAPEFTSDIDDETASLWAERISRSGARLCLVSLGAPKQELLADALHEKCPEVGFLCVGAALDFISGHMMRAPEWMQRYRLEWFWRLASDPKRLVSRYLGCLFLLAGVAVQSPTRSKETLILAASQHL